LEPRPFLERVWAELGGVRDRVVAYAPGEVVLEGGRRLRPELVLYAGGARGAGVFGLEGRFIAGLELLLLEYREEALSYRVFLAGVALGEATWTFPATKSPLRRKGRWRGFCRERRAFSATGPGWPGSGGGCVSAGPPP
jgi:hypothetical protein